MTHIIGLLGASGAGKTEVAKHLVNHHGYTRLRFADPMKDMLKALGMTEDQVDGPDKAKPVPLLGGATFRHAAQTLGTEWGRKLIHQDLWVRALEHRLLTHLLCERTTKIVIDDVRFPNELALVTRYRGLAVTVRNPRAEPRWGPIRKHLCRCGAAKLAGVHPSEVLYRLLDTPARIKNSGSITDLCAQVDALVARLPSPKEESAHACPGSL